MNEEAFNKYYASALQVTTDSPPPHILKAQEYFKIKPNEVQYQTLDKFSFTNQNLDIITLPSDSYLYMKVGIKHASGAEMDTNADMVYQANGTIGGADHVNATFTKNPDRYWQTMSVPASASFIGGYTYKINDTTIDTQNSETSLGLNAVNSGVFSPANKADIITGMTEPHKYLLYQAHKKAGYMEFLCPLRYVVPFFGKNQSLWGVKQTLEINKASVIDTFAYYNPDFVTGFTLNAISELDIKTCEWYLPYVRIENQTQSEIYDSMYNNKISRYWLGREVFVSTTMQNNQDNINEVYKVASRGVNHQPRWLIINAVDGASATIANNNAKPLGFVNKTSNAGNENNFCLSRIRIKLNGIFVDGGSPLEMDCMQVSASGDKPYNQNAGYWEPYIKYCKWHNQMHDAEILSPLAFNDWLQSQIYVFDLVNTVDTELIFQNSNNTVVIEVEYSTKKGCTANRRYRIVATLLHDKQIEISHSKNSATIISN
jgi:hypothetical protein